MRLITLYLPELWLESLDHLVAAGFHANRAQAIRAAVRDLLILESSLVPGHMETTNCFGTPSPNQTTQKKELSNAKV